MIPILISMIYVGTIIHKECNVSESLSKSLKLSSNCKKRHVLCENKNKLKHERIDLAYLLFEKTHLI